MFKIKNEFIIIAYIFIFICLGGLFLIINNHQIMAMDNGHSNGHVPHNNRHNNHYTNFELQARILQDLNFEQTAIVSRIFNARNNNYSEEVINDLMRQNVELSSRIAAQQIILNNAMPQQNNQNQPNNPRRH